LNNEPGGTIADPSRLENALRKLFDEREKQAVFREHTDEIEKTVFLKVSKSLYYDDFLKLVVAVKRAGADPIGIQLDDLD
jgi:biopolymer transport protein ExbD